MSEPTAEDWESVSLLLEQATGYDSIPTIEGHYVTDKGTFRCVYPGCKFTRSNAYDLWRHVHFSPNHGPSFGVSTTYEELCVLAEKLVWMARRRESVVSEHDYLSTACLHAEHDRCRKVCKFCPAACRCDCHEVAQ